jgi:ribosome recycling factor
MNSYIAVEEAVRQAKKKNELLREAVRLLRADAEKTVKQENGSKRARKPNNKRG